MATLPSTTSLTVTKAVIPLTSRIKPEDEYKVTIERYVTVGAPPNERQEKRKFSIPGCKVGEPEAFLRTIVEFLDLRDNNRLAITGHVSGFEWSSSVTRSSYGNPTPLGLGLITPNPNPTRIHHVD